VDEGVYAHFAQLQQLGNATHRLIVSDGQALLLRYQPASLFVYTSRRDGTIELLFETSSLCEHQGRLTVSACGINAVFYSCASSTDVYRVSSSLPGVVEVVLENVGNVSHLDVSADGSSLLYVGLADGAWVRYNWSSESLRVEQQLDCISVMSRPSSVSQAPPMLGISTVVLELPFLSSTVAFGHQLVSGQWIARLLRKQDLGMSPSLDFDLHTGVTVPCNVSSLALLKQCVAQCPAVEWLTSTMYAIQLDHSRVSVHEGAMQNVFEGELSLNGGDGVLLLSDKDDLLASTWLDIRMATNLSNVTRVHLVSQSGVVVPAASNLIVRAVYWQSRLQVLFLDHINSRIVTVDASTSSLDLNQLAHDNYGLPYAALDQPSSPVVVQRRYVVPVSVSVGVTALALLVYIAHARARRYRGYRQQSDEDLLDDKVRQT
jgi:hypothetical protein